MTTFEDFKAKCAEIKKATDDYEAILKNSFAEFWLKYVESFDFPGDTFPLENGKPRRFVSLISNGRHQAPESVTVDLHKGISVNVLTVIDNSDLANLREDRFHLDISWVNDGVNYRITETGFFDEKSFQNIDGNEDYLEVIDYIKSAFMNNILKDFPGSRADLDA